MASKVNYLTYVYQFVKDVPQGKVTTYGEIANRIKSQFPQISINAKMVGWALHANRSANVPCHRVVDAKGKLAPNFAFNGAAEQRRRLAVEGVSFADEVHVDLRKHLWIDGR